MRLNILPIIIRSKTYNLVIESIEFGQTGPISDC